MEFAFTKKYNMAGKTLTSWYAVRCELRKLFDTSIAQCSRSLVEPALEAQAAPRNSLDAELNSSMIAELMSKISGGSDVPEGEAKSAQEGQDKPTEAKPSQPSLIKVETHE